MRTIKMKGFIFLLVSVGFSIQLWAVDQNHESKSYRMIESGGRWQLLRDGKPFYIKGAVGWVHLDVLKDSGGNAVRTRANRRNLDQAWKYGLAAMAGLPVRGERNGMDWGDQHMVNQQERKILDMIAQFKDHPAVMF